MTDPAPEPPRSTRLEEAAAELRKARDDNEKRAGIIPSLAVAKVPTDAVIAEVHARRMEIAEGFTRLAAIEAGLPPGCCHARPGPESQ